VTKHSSKKQSEKNQHDEVMEELVTRLEGASKRLNAAAERTTQQIEALEERLVAAEPGIEVWGATLLTEQTTFRREGSDAPESAERVVRLGYARVKKGKWGLVAREVVKSSSGMLLSEENSLLHKAERNLRLVASRHLPTLIRQIVEAVEAQAVGLEDGEEDDDTRAALQGNDSAARADN
jgi:hypothetical protein